MRDKKPKAWYIGVEIENSMSSMRNLLRCLYTIKVFRFTKKKKTIQLITIFKKRKKWGRKQLFDGLIG